MTRARPRALFLLDLLQRAVLLTVACFVTTAGRPAHATDATPAAQRETDPSATTGPTAQHPPADPWIPGAATGGIRPPGPEPLPPLAGSPSPRTIFTITAFTLATTGAVVFVGGVAWWRDSGFVGWSWRDTGWFGGDTYAGGADKVGHFYTWYVGSRLLHHVYRGAGLADTQALWAGAGVAFFLANVVEVVDGFTSFGFEYGDFVANSLGIALGMATLVSPTLDAWLGVRLAYVPSPAFIRGEKNYIKLVNDYAGQLCFFDLKLAGLETLGVDPGLLRYLNVGLTYTTDDYQPRGTNKQRWLGAHVSLNLAEIMHRGLGESSAAARTVTSIARYYALPFTALIAQRDLNHGGSSFSFGVANRPDR